MNRGSAVILIVEDENIVALDIRNSLQRLGYAVPAIVNSGEEAIERVAEIHPNLVLMDIRLPGAMDGVQAAEIIRRHFNIPIIYLTAHSEERTVHQAKLTQPYGYILKPFEEKELQVAIEIALYKHEMERKLQEEKQRLDTIIKSIGDALIVTDANGQIQIMNPIAEALTGWRQDEAIGKDLVEVLSLVNKETGEATENLATQVMQAGVVLTLPENCTLIARDGTQRPIGDSAAPIRDPEGNITGAVLIFQDITARKLAEERLLRNAFYDGLTELPNRVLFLDRVHQAIERCKRHSDYYFAVLFLDLDGFKAINDRYGHSTGDSLLVAIAQRMQSCLRTGDTVARLGGDEFGILLEEIKDVTDATRVANRILDSLASPLNLNGRQLFITASIGIAMSTKGYQEPENLLRDADTAMYRAKIQGKARYQVFDEETSSHEAGGVLSLSLQENDLRSSIEHNHLRLLYQPIVSLASGRIAGFEALVRLWHPIHGLVNPPQFMPVAEATGLINLLGTWVLHEACRQIHLWQSEFPTQPPLIISVNVSAKQIGTPDFIVQVERILQQFQVEPHSLQLEITESRLIEDSIATPVFQQLRNRGIHLAIDNFGTGYSSLSYLQRFPINKLNIDSAFIRRMNLQPQNWEILQTIMSLAHNLGIEVVAKGVENSQQLAQLRQLRCEYGQGYFFSHPLDSSMAEALLLSAPQW